MGQIDGIENQSFLKIDLKDLDFTRIENAKLRLTASTADFATLSAHITTADWKESEINGINAPQLDEQIGTISINKGATTYTLDITTAIKEVIANDNDFLSIALKSENGSVSFFSKENATDQPVLILNEEETNLGTDQFAQSEEFFLVYPNPVKNNILKIHSKNLSENLTKISMVSLSGQSFPFPSFSGREEQQLDLSRLSSGTYFLVIESSDNQKFNKKIIVP
ncbi:Por secretion system C-terminal sorting domain-containing protein [Flavobacterium aquidurense]|uniref:Por secretion system C-terminal sorting domain-containing protein n=1 Tax=Flavobacterium frigidimaris TaxID=262320 RepID=A0ABX4BT40_FLAFR|nr:hypothetical protein B0A65_05375 [Flavobacterium frigidimaris]SDZ08472.1 Por secretion system C-terminal sorting domain-containing protein [Flavobacterium aquidurense]